MPPLEHSLDLRNHQLRGTPDCLSGRSRAELTSFITRGIMLGVRCPFPLMPSSYGVEMKKLILCFEDAHDMEFWMQIQLCQLEAFI